MNGGGVEKDSSSVDGIKGGTERGMGSYRQRREGQVGPPDRVSARDGQPKPFAVKTMGAERSSVPTVCAKSDGAKATEASLDLLVGIS